MRDTRKKVIPKKRGRPATGKDPVMSLRMPLELRARVEAWAADRGLTVSKAICELLGRAFRQRQPR
jgi:hypothetical protein